MSRLTKQYEDTKRYYSTHSFDEVLQKLGKLEDKEEAKKVEMQNHVFIDESSKYVDEYEYNTADCPHCGKEIYDDGEGYTYLKNADYCPFCGGRINWGNEDE